MAKPQSESISKWTVGLSWKQLSHNHRIDALGFSIWQARYSIRLFPCMFQGIVTEESPNFYFHEATMNINCPLLEDLSEMYDPSKVDTLCNKQKQYEKAYHFQFSEREQCQYRIFGQTVYMDIFTSPIVTIVVGRSSPYRPNKNAVIFQVHKDLLTTYSLFFRAALTANAGRSNWHEGKTGIMHLPEDRAEDFGVLISWMYRSLTLAQHSRCGCSVPCSHPISSFWHFQIDPRIESYKRWKSVRDSTRKMKMSADERKTHIESRPQAPTFGPLIRLYILANKYNVQYGLDFSISKRVRDVGREANCVPCREDVNMVWDQLLTEDAKKEGGLKRVIVEMYTALSKQSFAALFSEENVTTLNKDNKSRENDRAHDQVDAAAWHQDFMRELLLQVIKTRKEELPPSYDKSKEQEQRQRVV